MHQNYENALIKNTKIQRKIQKKQCCKKMDLILNANDSDCNDDDDDSEDSDVEFSVEDANSNGADSSDESDSDDDEPLAKLVGASVQQSNKAKKKEYTWRKGTFNPIK